MRRCAWWTRWISIATTCSMRSAPSCCAASAAPRKQRRRTIWRSPAPTTPPSVRSSSAATLSRSPRHTTQETTPRYLCGESERRANANGDAPWRRQSRTGEDAGEVDDVQPIHQIEHVDLHAKAAIVTLVEAHADRRIEREIGLHASLLEVHAPDNTRTVLGDRIDGVALELNGKAAAVRCRERKPQSRRHIIAGASSHRVALIL